ncbi:hypothetical protein [Mycobacterium sp. 3519A]|uniref:hypothetical protein n=1 Tax=Mycobacterium sp. 3519A TaxID=2057184 RepID=UPI000C7A537F|nr:hypothetical protein [Mycobacterium sp. 3519A]
MSLSIRRLARILAPNVGIALLRGSQLLILALLARSPVDIRSLLLTGFGLLAAFAMLSDSGATLYVLGIDRNALTRSVLGRSLVLQGITIGVGLSIGVTFTLIVSGKAGATAVMLLVALALNLAVDSLTRTAKAPLLVLGRDGAYGLLDLALGAAKVAVLAVGILQESLLVMLALPLPGLVGLFLVTKWVARRLPRGQPAPAGMTREILTTGVAGALSAGYSQMAVLVGSAMLPLHSAALLAASTRIVQSMELIPSTFFLQVMPRLRKWASSWRRVYGGFLTLGAVLALAAYILRGLLEAFTGVELDVVPVFGLLLITFVLKSGNYFLVARLLVLWPKRVWVMVNIVVNVVALALAVIGCMLAGLFGAGMAAVGIEMTFATLALLVMQRLRPRDCGKFETG